MSFLLNPFIYGLAFGTYELLADTIVGTATTSVDFTGLSLGKGDEILLVSSIANSSGSNSEFAFFVNGNTTATNYYYQSIFVDNTSVVGGRDNSAKIGYCLNGTAHVANTKIKLSNSGYFVWQSDTLRNSNGSSTAMQNIAGTSTFTLTSITSLTVTATSANAISIGSRFQLYRIGGA
ncbi:MAG: hypothetical protein WCO84_01400 [bacterium]